MGRRVLSLRSLRTRSTFAALLAAFLAVAATSGAAEEPSARRGGAIVKLHCGGCHATGTTGASRHPAAPPLRELNRRYEPEALAEALAEGILTGHPAMPAFRFEPHDVRSIILYLNDIQDRQTSSADRGLGR
jgi:mono/diheme cytochrome c family protein